MTVNTRASYLFNHEVKVSVRIMSSLRLFDLELL